MTYLCETNIRINNSKAFGLITERPGAWEVVIDGAWEVVIDGACEVVIDGAWEVFINGSRAAVT